MKSGAIADLACPGSLGALAAFYYTAADAIPTSLLSDAVGADGLPKLLALSLAALCALLALRTVITGGDARAISLVAHDLPLGLALIGIAYVVLAPKLGYAVTLALLIAATLVYFGARSPGMIILNAIGGAVAGVREAAGHRDARRQPRPLVRLNEFALAWHSVTAGWALPGTFAGVIWGIIGGALPGISPSIAMALLLPFTHGMDPVTAIVMLASV